jgi:hypothetical protein
MVFPQLFPITQIALRRAILQHRAVDVTDSVEGLLWGRQIGLADIQMIHVYPSLLGVIGQRSQLADRRSRHLISSDRYGWHNKILLIVQVQI